MKFLFCFLVACRFSYEDIKFQSLSIFEIFVCILIAFLWKTEHFSNAVLFFILAVFCYFLPLGIGEGDFLVLGIWSFFYGQFFCFLLLFTGSFFGLLYVVCYFFRKKEFPKSLPFLPFLSIGLICQVFLLDEVFFTW